jgi:hypothetical protein
MLLTTGGVSMGDYDMVKDIIARDGEMVFWKVKVKPGKPLAFGKIKGRDKKPATPPERRVPNIDFVLSTSPPFYARSRNMLAARKALISIFVSYFLASTLSALLAAKRCPAARRRREAALVPARVGVRSDHLREVQAEDLTVQHPRRGTAPPTILFVAFGTAPVSTPVVSARLRATCVSDAAGLGCSSFGIADVFFPAPVGLFSSLGWSDR